MAGDWIKVETSTSHKAEVLYMAELLGVSRQECMGYLIDYWSWLDANARTEFVPNLSRSCLDSVMNCPGIAAALEHVGWLKWDQNGAVAQVVNYGHHNGASAKTRAYEQKKKQAQRGQNRDKTGTREEKRREENSSNTNTPPARKRASPLPPDFGISDKVRQWANGKGFGELESHLEFFKGKAVAKAYTYADWEQAFMNSVREDWGGFRKPGFAGKPQTLAERRVSNMDRITGQTNGRRIDGTAERVDSPTVPALPASLRIETGFDVGRRGPERTDGDVGD